jgi:hypothetical protein
LETGGARGRKMAARAVSGADARGSVGGALRWVLGGCGVAVALVALVVWQYPPVGAAAGRYALYGAGAAGALLAVAGAVALRGRRGRPGAVEAFGPGVRVGAVLGLAWVAEIGFNNLPPPEIATGAARFLVDNGVWAAISPATVALGAMCAWRAGSAGVGAQAGLWSGLVSGLCACLAALLLDVAGMPLLLRDPLNQAEWAARGPASGAPNLPTYLAYEPLAGAVGHLGLIGIVFGLLLGAVGGLLGVGLRRLRGASR